MMYRSQTAFSLVDLCVSVALIGVLVGILLPAVVRSQESARLLHCMANLRGVGQGSAAYQSDFHDLLPAQWLWEDKLAYNEDRNVVPGYVPRLLSNIRYSGRTTFGCHAADELFRKSLSAKNDSQLGVGNIFLPNMKGIYEGQKSARAGRMRSGPAKFTTAINVHGVPTASAAILVSELWQSTKDEQEARFNERIDKTYAKGAFPNTHADGRSIVFFDGHGEILEAAVSFNFDGSPTAEMQTRGGGYYWRTWQYLGTEGAAKHPNPWY